MDTYYMVWGGDCDGIYRASDHKQVASARQFSDRGWYNLIGASAETINRIGKEKDAELTKWELTHNIH